MCLLVCFLVVQYVWTVIGETNMVLNYVDRNNDESRQWCQNNHMDMIMIKTESDYDEVKNKLTSESVDTSFQFWIALYWNRDQHQFLWRDNTVLNFSHWCNEGIYNSNEPDCMTAKICDWPFASHQDCVRLMYYQRSTWCFATIPCNYEFKAMCGRFTIDPSLTTATTQNDVTTFLSMTTSSTQNAGTTSSSTTSISTQNAGRTSPSTASPSPQHPGTTSSTRMLTTSTMTKKPEAISCQCPCSSLGKGARQDFSNYTIDELFEMLAPQLAKMEKELSVDKSNLSATVNKRISAKDERKSSQSIGILGIVFIVSVILGVVIIDLISLIHFLKPKLKRGNTDTSGPEERQD